MSDIIRYLSFSVWLIDLLHVPWSSLGPFMLLQMALLHFFLNGWVYSIVCMYHFFIHSLVNGHLGCFHVMVIVNSAAVNTRLHVSFQIMVFSRYMSWSGVEGSYMVAIRASLVAYIGKESACNAGEPGSIPGLGRPPGEGNGNLLQYSCLENSMDREVWQATVHVVT